VGFFARQPRARMTSKQSAKARTVTVISRTQYVLSPTIRAVLNMSLQFVPLLRSTPLCVSASKAIAADRFLRTRLVYTDNIHPFAWRNASVVMLQSPSVTTKALSIALESIGQLPTISMETSTKTQSKPEAAAYQAQS
jgi:hypothetical protein